ncbi:hypothetical protein JVU11DRAFT_2251 [Chiua virens]|nr:hypothetical protein JVU11DRAFT_2251 [Chiua virens]
MLTLTESGYLLSHPSNHGPGSDGSEILVGGDLQPLMALKNLRHLDFNLKWSIGLTDDDLVKLVSAWPHLEHLLINQLWGWRQTSGGITADGITRLLHMCRSLNQLALVIDSRSSFNTQIRPVSRSLSIDVLDSTIEAASLVTMSVFFAALAVLMSGTLELESWNPSKWRDNSMVTVDDFERWEVVFAQRWKVLSIIASTGL